MTSPFAEPAEPGSGIQLGDHLGALLLIDVLSIESDIKTAFGDSDAIRANVYVIEGAGSPAEYEDTLLFPKVLQGQLRKSIGQKVLGRLTQGTAKPGQSPPWLLNAAAPEEIVRAEAWVAANAKPIVSSAQPPF